MHLGPDVFDGVEFRRVWRQRQQGDVVGNTKCIRAMPTGAVEHENSMRALGDGAGNFCQVSVHGLRVRVGHDQRGGRSALGTDGPEDVGGGVAGIAGRAGAAAPRGPDAGQRTLLADPRFILKPHLQGLAPGMFR